MKRRFSLLALLMAVAVMFAVAPMSMADTVQYSTNGAFNGNTFASNAAVTYGTGANTATVSFAGAAAVTPQNTPTTGSLGTFTLTATGTGASVSAGQTFSFQINQTLPGVASGTLTGNLSGTITENSSTGQLQFDASQTTVQVGEEFYTLPSAVINLNSPTVNAGAGLGVTTVQVEISSVPEPSSMLLFGTGLSGLAATLRRRVKK